MHNWLTSGLVVAMMMTLPTLGWARSSSVDARLSRLEHLVDAEKNYALLNQLEVLQQELRELRGTIEEQNHEITLLKQKQEKLFLNLDSRVNALTATQGGKPITGVAADMGADVAAMGVQAGVATGSVAAAVPAAVVPVPVVGGKEAAERKAAVPQVVKPAHAPASERDAYNAAHALMQDKQYKVALESFKQVLREYPNGTYTPNVYYWMGEIYLLEWHQAQRLDQSLLDMAQEAFRTVSDKYAKHQKGEDALLKLGLIELELHHWEQAKDILMQVIKNSPGSSRARIAEARINKMQQQGHL